MKKFLLAVIMLCTFACFSITTSAQVVSCDCTAGVSAGMPMGPADPTFILGSSMATDMAAAYIPTPAETGATDYIFIVTDPANLIIGSSADGSFDFSAYTEGAYGFTGFVYNQSQLVTLAQTLDALPATTLAGLLGLDVAVVEAIQAAIDPATVTIDDFLFLLDQLSTEPQTVETVAATLEGIACGATSGAFVAAYFATTPIPAYLVEVVSGSVFPDECDGATTLDLSMQYQGPFDNTAATATEALDPAIINACFPFAGGDDAQNSLWYTFVGDGGTYHIYTSAECGGGLNLNDEGTYIPFGDTQMLLFTGDACDAITPLACNEDDFVWGASETDYFAGLTVATEPGVTYYLWIDGFQGSAGQFCVQVAPEPCGNIEFTSEAATTALCDGDVITFAVNDATLNLGTAPDANPVIILSTGSFDSPEGLGSYTIVQSPAQFAGNADGTFTFTDQTGTDVTVSAINAIGVILSGSGGIDFNCSTNVTPTYAISFLSADDPACSGGDPCEGLAPANDNCPDAIMLTIGNGVVNGPYTNNCATGEGALPADIADCFTDYEADATAHDTYDNAVWFMFVGDGSTVTLTTNVDGVANPIEDGDTQLAIFEGACDGPSVGCSDDIDFDLGNYASSVTVVTVPGTTYYVVVDGFFTGDNFYPDFYSNGDFNIAVATEGGVEPLEAAVVETTVDEVSNTYVVSFAVTGGTAPYTFDDPNVQSIGGDFYLSGSIPCGTDYMVLVTDADGNNTMLTVTAPCDIIEPPTCLADYGIVTPPAQLAVCAGGTSAPIEVEGDNQTGFQTIFVITDGLPNLNILGASYSNEINFGALDFPGSALGAGTYTIHAFNFDMAQAGDIITALTSGDVSTGFEAQAAIDAGIICGELDVTGFQMSVATPILINAEVICDEAVGASTINVTISGGLPAISGDYIYTYSNALNSSSDLIGTSFILGPYTDGQGITLIVSDGCPVTYENADIACSKCDFNAGVMSSDAVSFCAGQPISVAGSVGYIAEGGAIIYILHTSADTVAGNIIAVDLDATDGTADFGVVSGLDPATTYYVSAVVGKDEDNDGTPDWEDECTKVAAGTPIVTGSNLTINVDDVCNTQTGQSTLTVVATGGSGNYTLVWDNGSDSNFNGTAVFTDVNNGSYTFTVTDDDCGGGPVNASIELACIKSDNVSWLPLTGEVLAQGNMLRWGTASETENDYFSIERSQDGVNFDAIGTIDGAGNSIQALSYEFMDKNAPAGMSYYRIAQVDFDGTTSQSNVVTLVRGESTFGIVNISPVPVVSAHPVTITFNSVKDSNISITVFDATGKVVAQLSNEAIHGLNSVEINANNFAAGVYFVQVSNGTDVANGKFIKE